MENLTDLNKIKRKFNNLNAKLKDVKLAYQCFLSTNRGNFCVDFDEVTEDVKTSSGGDFASDFLGIHSNFKTLLRDKDLKQSRYKSLFVKIYICEMIGWGCNYDEIYIDDDDFLLSEHDKEVILQIANLF